MNVLPIDPCTPAHPIPATSPRIAPPTGGASIGAILATSLGASLALIGAVASSPALGASVSDVLVERVQATPFRYEVDGVTYDWGVGDNVLMLGFVADGRRYSYSDSVSRVELRRDDIAGIADGNPCGVFVERIDGHGTRLAADYPSDGSGTGNCDMAELLASRVVNRGALDLFSNRLPDAKNIERADFIFDYGILAPIAPGALDFAGHALAEKRGNNPVLIAAILELDAFGQPSRYGTPMLVGARGCGDDEICYADSQLRFDFAFLQNRLLRPQGFPEVTELSNEFLSMAFVSDWMLGLEPGQRYFGFSLFADDVDANVHVLTDPSTFPNDTADTAISPGDDADIHGGLAGYFLADELITGSGRVFLDSDGDGRFGDGDAGVSDLRVTLYQDVDGNGALDTSVDIPLGDTLDSDAGGVFRFPGLADGDYLVQLDGDDVDVPDGLIVAPGSNPRPFTVAGGDPGPLDFALVQPGDGVTDAGGTDGDTGATDAGQDDAGQGDAGQGDAGQGDAGQSDAGQGDAGQGDAGQGDAGQGDAGQGDAGQGDAGQSDAGQDDAGQVDAGTDGGLDGAGGDDGGDTGGVLDDPSTSAAPDRFTVNQGETLDADVLRNDNDGAGGGLTIVSTGGSPNATIEIDGDLIRYTPDFGFHGTDTFVYTVEDTDGDRSTGAVTVQVLRFSDINRNGLNDFDECAAVGLDCSDLELETGVNGSGIGRFPGALSALLALLWWRRRRRRRATRIGGASR